jgi:hypothetical protein
MVVHSEKNSLSAVDTWIADCREAYVLTKKSSLRAASYAYLVWRASFGPEADQAARRDVARRIAETNAKIAKDNGRLKKLRDGGKRLNSGDEIKDEEFNKLKESHQDKVEARRLASLTLAKFNNELSVEIKYGEFDPDQTRQAVVKHAMPLLRNSERSKASRYAMVVKWIDGEFARTPLVDLAMEDILETLELAGGFEEVLVKERAKKPNRHVSKPGRTKLVAKPSDDAKVTQEAAAFGFKAETFDVSIKLPDDLDVLPEGRLTLECVFEQGLLRVINCTVQSNPDLSAESSDEAPALQPEQMPTQQKNQLSPTT